MTIGLEPKGVNVQRTLTFSLLVRAKDPQFLSEYTACESYIAHQYLAPERCFLF